LVHSVPLTLPELLQALARLNPPPRDRDSSPELPDPPIAPPLCRSPVSGPVLAAGALPMSSPDLPHLFQPSPTTPYPPRRPSTPSPSTLPPWMVQHRSISHKPPAPHRNLPSLIQRFRSTDIGSRPRTLPLSPTRKCLRPLALGPAGQPASLPNR
jgi:hypothetical protein